MQRSVQSFVQPLANCQSKQFKPWEDAYQPFGSEIIQTHVQAIALWPWCGCLGTLPPGH